MQRRRALQLISVAALAAAGCVERPGRTNGASPTATHADGPPTETDPSPTTTTQGTLTIESVETYTYAIRLDDQGRSPERPVKELADVADRERMVVVDAIGGGYEVSDPPEWLVAFLAHTPVVLADGRYYQLEHTLPTTEITAEVVEASAVYGDIADYQTYEEAVTSDGREMSYLIEVAGRRGVELTYIWPELRSFLESYDAVRYEGDVLDFSVSVHDPGAPYEVVAERLSLEDLANGPVWDAADASAETRDLLREAARTNGIYSFSEAPPGLLENLRDHLYVYLDGTFYDIDVEKRMDLPVTFTAEFVDPTLDDEGARLRLAVHNDSDHEIRYKNGPPLPFGVLRFRPADEPEPRFLLWSDAYEESDGVQTDGRTVRDVADGALHGTIKARESVDRTFTIYQDLPAGAYVLANDIRMRHPDAGGTVPYEVRFRLVV